jgi:hypothetical protein
VASFVPIFLYRHGCEAVPGRCRILLRSPEGFECVEAFLATGDAPSPALTEMIVSLWDNSHDTEAPKCGKLQVDRFRAHTACGWRKDDVRPDYYKAWPRRTIVGWIMSR